MGKIFLSCLFFFIVLFIPCSVFANSQASLSLAPNKNQLDEKELGTVLLTVNSGESLINAVQLTISYPSNKLDFLGIDSSQTAFAIQAENTGSNGIIKIARGTIQPVKGEKIVAKVLFSARTRADTKEISIINPTLVLNSTTNQNIFTGTVYTIPAGSTSRKVNKIEKIKSPQDAPPPVEQYYTSPAAFGQKGIIGALTRFNNWFWDTIFTFLSNHKVSLDKTKK